MTYFDNYVIKGENDIPWDKLPDWVNWWIAESWGGSWGWQNEPELVDSEDGFGQYWLASSGYTPIFAGWVEDVTGVEWKNSKTRRPGGPELGDPIVIPEE